jgi:glycosyltransferase involved in cell wall biosynthesis
MEIIAKRNPAAACVVAGQGRQHAELQAKIDRLGLSERVRLLGFRDDVTQIIAAADMFVLPAEAEPFGLVILEAMEAAVPVIATDAGGPREIVVPAQTGWLVKPNDPAALAIAIEQALADPTRAKQFGAAGRERLLRDFTAERMARETIEVYRRAIEHSKQIQ